MNRSQFSNTVKTEWVEDSKRDMILLEEITFTDARGKVWVADAGELIDGASIPKFFWRTIGSPFVGLYRRASVIHDVYCKSRKSRSKFVHKMFREAMLADGVPEETAETMYFAVRRFGPKW